MKYLKPLVGVLISILFLYLSLKRVNFHDALRIIYHVKWWWLICAVFTVFIALITRSFRWRIIINRKDLPVRSFFDATCVGQMSNNVFPFRAGDFIQAYFLSFKEKLGKSLAFSTVIIERLTDMFPPIFILIIGSFFVFLPEKISRGKITLFGVIMLAIVFVIVRFNNAVLNFLENMLPPSGVKQKLHSLIGQFHAGISFIRDPKTVVIVILFTLLQWFLYGMGTYFSLLAFDIHIGYFGALLACSITAVSVAIPSSPGYVGTWEFFSILALGIFKIDKDIALSYSLVNHLINLAVVTGLGFFIVVKSGFSMAKMNQAAAAGNPSEMVK